MVQYQASLITRGLKEMIRVGKNMEQMKKLSMEFQELEILLQPLF